MGDEESQRATVNGKAFDVEDFEAMTGEQRLKRGHREIEHVFVIDGVEFGMFDEIDGIRKFEDDAAFGLEQGFKAGDEVIGVWGMGKDIVAEDEVGFFAGGGEFCGEVVAEEFDQGLDAFFACDFGDVGGRLDAEAGNFGFGEVLEQVTVVAGDFDDVAVGVQGELADVALDRFAGMTEKSVGKGGKIEIFGEKLRRRDEVGDLQEPAGLANGEAEGEFGLGLGKVLGTKEVVGKGLQAEVQDEFAVGRIAGAAAERGFSRRHGENWIDGFVD